MALLMFAALIPLIAIGVTTFESEPGVCTDSITGDRYACDVPTGGTVVSWLLLGLIFIVISFVVLYAV